MKKCDTCGHEMDRLMIFQLGKPVFDQQVCPICDEPEIRRFMPRTSKRIKTVTRFKLLGAGAFSLN